MVWILAIVKPATITKPLITCISVNFSPKKITASITVNKGSKLPNKEVLAAPIRAIEAFQNRKPITEFPGYPGRAPSYAAIHHESGQSDAV